MITEKGTERCNIAGFEDGGSYHQEWNLLPEAGMGKETGSILEPSEGNTALLTPGF